MKHNSETTFWGGKRGAEVSALSIGIPTMGEVKDKSRPILEEYRKLSNAYYRWYNDGDEYYGKLRYMAERFSVNLKAGSDESLEELADAVFEAALNEKAGIEARKA